MIKKQELVNARKLLEKSLIINEKNLHQWVNLIIGCSIVGIKRERVIKEVESCFNKWEKGR